MPQLILAAAWFLKPTLTRTADAHALMTRSRSTTRRLRVSKAYEPYYDLSPLDLRRRH